MPRVFVPPQAAAEADKAIDDQPPPPAAVKHSASDRTCRTSARSRSNKANSHAAAAAVRPKASVGVATPRVATQAVNDAARQQPETRNATTFRIAKRRSAKEKPTATAAASIGQQRIEPNLPASNRPPATLFDLHILDDRQQQQMLNQLAPIQEFPAKRSRSLVGSLLDQWAKEPLNEAQQFAQSRHTHRAGIEDASQTQAQPSDSPAPPLPLFSSREVAVKSAARLIVEAIWRQPHQSSRRSNDKVAKQREEKRALKRLRAHGCEDREIENLFAAPEPEDQAEPQQPVESVQPAETLDKVETAEPQDSDKSAKPADRTEPAEPAHSFPLSSDASCLIRCKDEFEQMLVDCQQEFESAKHSANNDAVASDSADQTMQSAPALQSLSPKSLLDSFGFDFAHTLESVSARRRNRKQLNCDSQIVRTMGLGDQPASAERLSEPSRLLFSTEPLQLLLDESRAKEQSDIDQQGPQLQAETDVSRSNDNKLSRSETIQVEFEDADQQATNEPQLMVEPLQLLDDFSAAGGWTTYDASDWLQLAERIDSNLPADVSPRLSCGLSRTSLARVRNEFFSSCAPEPDQAPQPMLWPSGTPEVSRLPSPIEVLHESFWSHLRSCKPFPAADPVTIDSLFPPLRKNPIWQSGFQAMTQSIMPNHLCDTSQIAQRVQKLHEQRVKRLLNQLPPENLFESEQQKSESDQIEAELGKPFWNSNSSGGQRSKPRVPIVLPDTANYEIASGESIVTRHTRAGQDKSLSTNPSIGLQLSKVEEAKRRHEDRQAAKLDNKTIQPHVNRIQYVSTDESVESIFDLMNDLARDPIQTLQNEDRVSSPLNHLAELSVVEIRSLIDSLPRSLLHTQTRINSMKAQLIQNEKQITKATEKRNNEKALYQSALLLNVLIVTLHQLCECSIASALAALKQFILDQNLAELLSSAPLALLKVYQSMQETLMPRLRSAFDSAHRDEQSSFGPKLARIVELNSVACAKLATRQRRIDDSQRQKVLLLTSSRGQSCAVQLALLRSSKQAKKVLPLPLLLTSRELASSAAELSSLVASRTTIVAQAAEVHSCPHFDWSRVALIFYTDGFNDLNSMDCIQSNNSQTSDTSLDSIQLCDLIRSGAIQAVSLHCDLSRLMMPALLRPFSELAANESGRLPRTVKCLIQQDWLSSRPELESACAEYRLVLLPFTPCKESVDRYVQVIIDFEHCCLMRSVDELLVNGSIDNARLSELCACIGQLELSYTSCTLLLVQSQSFGGLADSAATLQSSFERDLEQCWVNQGSALHLTVDWCSDQTKLHLKVVQLVWQQWIAVSQRESLGAKPIRRAGQLSLEWAHRPGLDALEAHELVNEDDAAAQAEWESFHCHSLHLWQNFALNLHRALYCIKGLKLDAITLIRLDQKQLQCILSLTFQQTVELTQRLAEFNSQHQAANDSIQVENQQNQEPNLLLPGSDLQATLESEQQQQRLTPIPLDAAQAAQTSVGLVEDDWADDAFLAACAEAEQAALQQKQKEKQKQHQAEQMSDQQIPAQEAPLPAHRNAASSAACQPPSAPAVPPVRDQASALVSVRDNRPTTFGAVPASTMARVPTPPGRRMPNETKVKDTRFNNVDTFASGAHQSAPGAHKSVASAPIQHQQQQWHSSSNSDVPTVALLPEVDLDGLDQQLLQLDETQWHRPEPKVEEHAQANQARAQPQTQHQPKPRPRALDSAPSDLAPRQASRQTRDSIPPQFSVSNGDQQPIQTSQCAVANSGFVSHRKRQKLQESNQQPQQQHSVNQNSQQQCNTRQQATSLSVQDSPLHPPSPSPSPSPQPRVEVIQPVLPPHPSLLVQELESQVLKLKQENEVLKNSSGKAQQHNKGLHRLDEYEDESINEQHQTNGRTHPEAHSRFKHHVKQEYETNCDNARSRSRSRSPQTLTIGALPSRPWTRLPADAPLEVFAYTGAASASSNELQNNFHSPKPWRKFTSGGSFGKRANWRPFRSAR